MKSRILGGILLVVGTSIGGGMLALPISTAEAGLAGSVFFLSVCWLVMTAGALLILEISLRFPAGNNIITMAKETLGLPGQAIAWTAYLLLLYTLLAGYISGGSDVLNSLLAKMGITLPAWAASVLFTSLFGFIVYQGMKTVDYVNRGLMFGKLGILALLIVIISPHIDTHAFVGGTTQSMNSSLMILITSFGFASIVPSLREYFKDDPSVLRPIILMGSLIPLACYILWDAVIMGVVSREGANGLVALKSSAHTTSGLVDALSQAVHSRWITGFFGFFSAICMVTAFLAVSIGLFDFLADGLSLKKQGHQGKRTLALTFIPPLTLALLSPNIYLSALAYAGICCVILLLLLPALMTWALRQNTLNESAVLVPGGRLMLSGLILISAYLLYLAACF